MEGGVDHARLHALADFSSQHGTTRTALNPHPIVLANTTFFGIVRMDFQAVFAVPLVVVGTSCLCPHVVLRQYAARGEQKRKLAGNFFLAGHVLCGEELALAAHKACRVHDVHACIRCVCIAWPLQAGVLVNFGVADTRKAGRECGNFFHNIFGVRIVHFIAQRLGEFDCDFPVRQSCERRHGFAHPRNTSLRIGKGAIFFQERRTGQKHMGVLGGFVQEDVLHHDAFHGGQSRSHVLGVGVGLHNVFALAVQTQEGTFHGRVKHIGDAQTWLRTQMHTPSAFKQGTGGGVGDVTVAR